MNFLRNRTFPSPRFYVWLTILSLTSGCMGTWKADYSGIELIPIEGTVTLDGTPLAGVVVFYVQEDGSKSYATADEKGFYKMKFNSEVGGVLPGSVTVEISTTAKTGELKPGDADGIPDPRTKKGKKKELVPAVYNKKSKLKLTVATGDRVYNFDLKSDGSTTGPTK